MTIYSEVVAPENDASAQLLTDRMNDACLEIQGLMPTSWTIASDSFVDDLDTATGALVGSHSVTPWTRTGGSSSGYGPLATGLCATWKTAEFVNGRRVAGRTFIVPIALEFQDPDGTPKSSAVTSVQNFGAAWMDPGSTDVTTVVWHRPIAGAGGSSHPITGVTVRDKFAVLRSRRD